jgi:hypothetical protein
MLQDSLHTVLEVKVILHGRIHEWKIISVMRAFERIWNHYSEHSVRRAVLNNKTPTVLISKHSVEVKI